MSDENCAKIDNLGLFDKVDEFVSIEKKEFGFREYEFIDLTSDEIKYLKSIVETLEKDEDVYLCARGDSKKDKHANFRNKQLYDFFIVGEKAKFHIRKPDEEFHHTLNNRKIIDDIKELALKCNEVLGEKSDRNKVGGKFSDQLISNIEDLPEKTQEDWKFVLLAFLHNKGVKYGITSDNYFKPYSGFVSLTYGQGKYDTAKKFAIERNKKGIIYTYILRKDFKQYFKTEDMNQLLKKYGVEWHEDKHNEIIILNGLFPHSIIGLFEVYKVTNKRFILNPWFHRQIKYDLKNNNKFDYNGGVLIWQENFQKAAIRLGYNSFFTRCNVFDMVNGDIKPNIERGWERGGLCEV